MSLNRTVWACVLGVGLTGLSASLTKADEPAGLDPVQAIMADAYRLSDRPAPTPTKTEEPYSGGRGLVTQSGMSGMFLNPTSGTLNQGQFTSQYCFLLPASNSPINSVHGLMLSYGVTDWLEVGAFLNFVDFAPIDDAFVAGPFARVRLLKDEGWVPEVSVGAIWLDGNDDDGLVNHTEAFIAASKLCRIDPAGFLRSFRTHVGFREIWNDVPDDNSVGFIGGELELPYSVYLIGEVDRDFRNNVPRYPWAAGFQWKPTGVVGISLAAMEAPGEHGVGLWFGVGMTFKF